MAHGFKQLLPWWVRIPVKIGLSRLPLPYSFWKSLGLFEHGDMNQPQRAFDTVVAHAKAAGVLDTIGATISFAKTSEGFTVLELGPGDSLFSAVIAKALGAAQTWLVDAGPFATNDMAAYRRLLDFLVQKGFALPAAHTMTTRDALLAHCGGIYLTSGVQALAQLPKASVDFCFSNAVLEHIPKGDFATLTKELKRVLKPDGVCLHRVDLKDHLGGGLNNLRFAEETWEGALFREAGFYTNRIRFGQMVIMFEQAGLACSLSRVVHWRSFPTPRSKLSPAFQALPDDDLLVSGFDVVLTHQKAGG